MERPRRRGAAALVLLLAVLLLAAPVGVGVLGGRLVGGDPLGLMACMVLAAFVAVWWSRVALTLTWWAKTGRWDWRRTSLRRSIAAGWGGPR